MNLFDLYVSVTLEEGGYHKAVESAEKTASTLGSRLKAGVAAAGKAAASAMGAAARAAAALGKLGLGYNAQAEAHRLELTSLLGDAGAAGEKLEELKAMAASTPFTLGDLSSAAQTLLSLGLSAEESAGALEELGDLARGDGGRLSALAKAYGELSASQTVGADQLRAMAEAGYDPLLDIQARTGESMEALRERLARGGVAFWELREAMAAATGEGGRFYQGVELAGSTTAGLLATLEENARALAGEVFLPLSQGLTETLLPGAVSAIAALTAAFRAGGMDGMILAAVEITTAALAALGEGLPLFLEAASAMVESLAAGVSYHLPAITEAAGRTLLTFLEGAAACFPQLASLALDLVLGLANGIVDNLPGIVAAAVTLMGGFLLAVAGKIPELLPLAWKLVVNLAEALVRSIPALVTAASDLGAAINDGIWAGIRNGWDWLTGKVRSIAGDLLEAAKEALGIHSPSRLFRDVVGKNISLGLAEGIEAGAGPVYSALDGLTQSLAPGGGLPIPRGVGGFPAPGGITPAPGGQTAPAVQITINGARYSDEQSLAAAVAREMRILLERRAAAHG